MSEKGTFETLYDGGKDLLKDGEQHLEDSFGKDIDIFTKSQEKLEKGKKTVDIETKKELIDLESSIVLNNTKKQLKNGFEEFKTKINSVSQVLLSDTEKENYIKDVKKEYDNIMQILNSYKNDGDFKKGYKNIESKVKKWIGKLDKQDSNNIVDSAKKNLEEISIDMSILNGNSKEKISQEKSKIKEKYENIDQDNQIEKMLKKFGVPAGIAGIIVTFFSWLGIGTKEKTMFTQMISFVKNPIDGVKGLFGLGKTEKEEESKTEPTIMKGKLKQSGNITNYTNGKLEIQLEKNKEKSIKINGIEYKFNLENLGDMSFIQNDKDILKIGNKEINLLNIIKKLEKNKDNYIISENFNNSEDLKLEKI